MTAVALLAGESKLIRPVAGNANIIIVPEPVCSFGATIQSNRSSVNGAVHPEKPILSQIRHAKRKMDKLYTERPKAPQIENLQEITPEQAADYIRFVATMRHNQKRWFNLHNVDALNLARQMEKELDALNAHLLDPTPKLF